VAAEADVPTAGIVIEITEGLLLDTSLSVKEKLGRLRAGGMQVALDDFGTGYSSLSYLSRLQIDYLKIDRLFVAGLAGAQENLILCDAMALMARRLGIKVVAEGIETAEQRRLLEQIGCEYGQGFLFSRPLTGEALEEILAAGRSAAGPDS
jgi:EAL domain-containing protein (putative c-di-GMP-specific phosphodiesterase class I)